MKEIKKSGLSLTELIVVIAIIAVLAAIAVPSLIGIINRSRLGVLEKNQRILESALIMERDTSFLPTIDSGTVHENRNSIRDILDEAGHYFSNPITRDDSIISSGQAGSNESAAIVISQRNEPIDNVLSSKGNFLWPLNAAQSSQEKFVGALVIQICRDGYLVFSYTEKGKAHNIRKIYFGE